MAWQLFLAGVNAYPALLMRRWVRALYWLNLAIVANHFWKTNCNPF